MSVKITYRDVAGSKETVVCASWASNANAHTLRSIHHAPTNYGDLDGTAVSYAIIENIREKVFRGARVELANAIKSFMFACDEKETWVAITVQPSVSGVKRAVMAILENVCPCGAAARYDSVVRSFGVKPSREAFALEADHVHKALAKDGVHIVLIGKTSMLKDDHKSDMEKAATKTFKDSMGAIPGEKKSRTLEEVAPHKFAFDVKLKGCFGYLMKKYIADKLHGDAYIIGTHLVSNTPVKESRLTNEHFEAFADQTLRQVKEDLSGRIAMRCAAQAYFPADDVASCAGQRLTKDSIVSHLKNCCH